MKHTLASTGHKEHKSKVFGALASHLSAEGAGLAGGPSLGAPKAEARIFHVVARSCVGPQSDIRPRVLPQVQPTKYTPQKRVRCTQRGLWASSWQTAL